MALGNFELAHRNYVAGRIVEACQLCDQHLREYPADPSGLMLAAEIHVTHGQASQASPLVTKALKSASSDHLKLLKHSVAAWELGFHREANSAWSKATRRRPQDMNYRFRHALFLMTSGRNDTALELLTSILDRDPQPEVHTLYGLCLRRLGRFDEAVMSIKTALDAVPNRAVWWNHLGDIRLDQRQFDEAIRSYQNALLAVQNTGEDNATAVVYSLVRLADCFARSNMIEEAWRFSDQAARIAPANVRHRFSDLTLVPIIYDSAQQMGEVRRRFTDKLQRLANELDLSTLTQSSKAAGAIKLPFYLHYQGGPDLPLQRQFGDVIDRIVSAWQPELSARPPMPDTQGKIRVGFASYLLNQHTVTKLFKGWIQGLDRRHFEVFAYHLGPVTDTVTRCIDAMCDGFVHLPGVDAATACRTIRRDELHVLIFPELGMSTTSMQLSALRSAPIQCMSWGHPVTSGLSAIDYMLSSDAMEPDDGQEHYTEQLVRLPGLSVAMSRPTAQPSNRSRADLGWAEDDVVFFVPQSLFKLLPTEDHIYPRIAKQVPNARFAFIHNSSTTVTGLFQRRMNAAFQQAGLDPAAHVCLLHGMGWEDYLRTNQLADVFLDGLTWSGGVTTMEAIAMGLVPITCPGHNMRARHTAAILTELGVTETIAKDHDEYVQLAVRLGNDPTRRADLSAKLLANVDHLYDDERVLPALEAFLNQAVQGTYQRNPTVTSGAMLPELAMRKPTLTCSGEGGSY